VNGGRVIKTEVDFYLVCHSVVNLEVKEYEDFLSKGR
jgi:hypothetical protein